MTTATLYHFLRRELADIMLDPWLLSLVSWIPPLLFVTMWWIFSQGIPTDLPIGVVDLDKSKLSRSLIRNYEASPSLAVTDSYLAVSEGASALRAGTIYGLVVLPVDLEEHVTLGRPPQVVAFVNSQFLLIGTIVSNALLEAQGTLTTKVEVVKSMATSPPVMDMALAAVMPITSQVTPLFNISKNYAHFLVSAILPAVWQIIMVAAAVLSMAFAQRKYGLTSWFGDHPCLSLTAKIIVLSILLWLQGLFFLSLMYVFLGWPMHGSWFLLIIAQAATALASVGIGCLIFLLIRDAARGLSIAAAYVAPGLAFMGVTFPVTDMTLPAKIWRSFIPVCHYIEIQFGQVNYAAPIITAIIPMRNLVLLLIPTLLAFLIIYRLYSNKGASLAEETA